ncbi:MAG: sulfite exporter TauE/SafE family protein [Burkholderiales bacterium]|nr:sulfite exporter TauE/SafE family protein [Burkholderiales bacterium]
MNAFDIIKIVAIICAVAVVIYFWRHFSSEKLTKVEQVKIAFIGFISNLLDTVGIGSFAVIVAMRRMLKVMPDDAKLIGSMNIQAVITALAQMLIFLHFIELDLTTMLVSIVMITIGGFLSGLIAVRVNRKIMHNAMLGAFIITGILLFLIQFNILEFASTSHAIIGARLIAFAIFMLIAGMLPAFGVGYYSLVKTSIFLFGVNPIIAFPIMAAASAYQMPVTAVTFINKKKFYAQSSILLTIFGLAGVFIAAPLISKVDPYTLKWILLAVVIYNIITIAMTKVSPTTD